MATTQGNRNVQTFLTIFCFIGALVGAVLAVINFSSDPAQTSTGTVFAVAAVVLLLGGIALRQAGRRD